LYDYWIGLLIC